MMIQRVLSQTRDMYTFHLLSDECVTKASRSRNLTTSDKIDRIVTNRMACASNLCSYHVCCILCISVTTIGGIVNRLDK